MQVESQIWIIGQILIDILLVILLLWFVKFKDERRIPWQDFESVFKKSQFILSEMREISLGLEKNLAEKKELSRHILNELEEGMKRAEESYRQISNVIRKTGTTMAGEPFAMRETNHTRSLVKSLSAKGLSKAEIAGHLGISVGEIDLLTRLQPKKEPSD